MASIICPENGCTRLEQRFLVSIRGKAPAPVHSPETLRQLNGAGNGKMAVTRPHKWKKYYHNLCFIGVAGICLFTNILLVPLVVRMQQGKFDVQRYNDRAATWQAVFHQSSTNDQSVPVDFVWNSIPEDKSGYGVIYSAYSFDENKSLPIFLQEAAESAEQLKRNNPGVPVAIITNAKTVPEVFDYIVPVEPAMLFHSQSTRPDGIFRQWFSRIYYLAHSPFRVTWYLDSHAAVPTTRLEEAMREFDRSGLDFATANQQPNRFFCHNFAMVYSWNNRTRTLFVDWMLRQLQRGISTDDQRTLCRAMACAAEVYGLKYGSISPNWSLAWLSLEWGETNVYWRHRTTRVISGPPQICHKADVCEVAATENDGTDRPRVLYMDSDLGPGSARAFYSQDEIDDVLPYNFKWDDWGSPQREIFASKSKSLSCERRPLPIKRISGKLFNSANVESCRQSLVTRPVESVYGAWTFCESALSPDPVVVSFGIGENMDWEIAMVKDYGATVYAHDPTPKAVEFVKKKQGQLNFLKSPMFVFTEVGLGAFDQDNVTMNLPSNPNFVSGRVGSKEKDSTRSVQIRLLSMESTLKLHGLQGKLIDIVKWDVEGVEFDVLDSLLNDTESTIPAKLLLLEWHARFESDGQSKQKDATEKLERVGFVKMHTSRNNEEEVFLNTRRPSTLYFVAEH